MKKALSILVVEDEEDLRDAYRLVLDSAGYSADCASNGKEAIECIKTKTPDVMLLDVYMPVMNGEEVLLRLTEAQKKSIRIIIFSNMSDLRLEDKLLQLGAEKFILKSSVSPVELIRLIEG